MKVKASYHQERLWFIHRFEAGNLYEAGPIYHNIPLILQIKGVLDIELLEKSITAVIERHNALRTRVITEKNQPIQVIEPEVTFKLEHQDLTDYQEEDKKEYAGELAMEFAKQPFKPDTDLLTRAKLIRLPENMSILVLCLHHMIADRCSLRIIAREVFLIYDAFLNARSLDLPWLSAHYADFSQWQYGFSTDILEPLLFYWKKKLKGKIQPLELPMDQPRPAVHIYHEGRKPFQIPKELFNKIEGFCHHNRKNKSLVLLAAFKLLLYKYSGQKEIVVGTSDENRDQPGLKPIVGPIANLVVLRSFLEEESGFLSFLNDLDKTVNEAKKYKDIPFEKLDQEIKPIKDMSRTVFFDVLFQYEDTPLQVKAPHQLEIQSLETNLGLGKYDLNLLLQETPGTVSGFLVYNKDYYDAAFIHRFIHHYIQLLERSLANPDLAISRLSILTAAEKNKLLDEFSSQHDTVGYPAHKTLHELFEKQVKIIPDNIAIIGPHQSNQEKYNRSPKSYRSNKTHLSYKKLNEKANQLAFLLTGKGVQPDTIVALLLERTIEMIIAVLGILKAGGAYLPIDPDYPEERKQYILTDSNACILLTHKDIEASPSTLISTSTCQVSPANLAYIIYTSGTTGKPKGVMIQHRNVVRLLFNDRFQFYFNDKDVWTMFHSYAFDFSVWEMYGALLYGAKLIMVSKMTAQDTPHFLERLKQECVTVLNQTPPAFYRLAQEELKQEQKHLKIKYVIFGGDVLKPAKLKEWKARYPETRLINMFGITETTVHVTYKELTDKEIKFNISSIGKPIPTLFVFIVDNNQNLAPIGVPGELWVGGKGVARGYLNRPELTFEKFCLRRPGGALSSLPPGKRNYRSHRSYIYRSGDLVKFTSEGNMIYLGRIDRQVKIRGHRIEPGEIENQLVRHAAVKDAVVIDREIKDDTSHLCAYLVLHSPRDLDSPHTNLITRLRDHLLARLPGYMVPSYFMYLDAIPLTPNGKLDRNALPEPVFTPARDYEAPGNEREEKLVKIWAEVLARKPDQPILGIHDNFFDLGGHSLNATIMTSKVREAFGIDVPLVEVFISPTIKALAEYIHMAKKEKSNLIKPMEEKEYYDTSYAQRRLWIICQFEDESAAYIMPNAFLLKGKFNQEAFTRTIQTLVNRHESLRTSFITIQGQPKQKIAKSLQFDLLQEDLSHLEAVEKAQQAKTLFAKFANQPFNLESGPLFRVKLIRLEHENYLLLSNIHHIITDGWAQGIVFSETIQLYNAFAAANNNPLPHLNYRYKDYSAWHNLLVDSGYLNEAELYWLEKFKDKPNGIELPLDHSRRARQTFNGGTIYFSINEEKTANLRQLALQHDATLFMGYLTLLNILLYRYTSQEDMILGLASSGRDHPGLQQLMGFLVNTLIFRHLIRPNQNFNQLLGAARQETMDCFKHQDYPFNLLVEKLELERDLSRSPLFNVMLSQNNTGIEGLDLNMTGLQVELYTDTEGFNMSVFDLVFFMNDTGTGIEASIMYNSDLFRTQSIERMAKNLQTLLDNILKDTNQPIASLDYIDPREYETIIHQFNDTDYPLPRKTVQELFEEQVEKTPHRTALIYNAEKITYNLLNKKANQLAHLLRQTCGIRPNDIVAVAFERSIEMITAVMGILKAGAGYLAIDPNYPADRVSHMLTHSRSPLLILDKPQPELLSDYKGRIIDIHADWHTIDRQPDFNPGIVNSPLDTIYVIYTSGSTGTPNGAMLSQDLLSNLLNWQRDKTGIDGSLRCLQFTTTSFCVSFQEIMTTLTSGGQLFLIGDIERQDIDYLMAFLVRHHIENLYLPFSYLNFLFNESNRFEAWFQQNLKHIITAGEQLKITAGLKTFLEANPSIKLHNHYGSSEMHVVTSYSLDAQTAELMPVPPAGTPIANTKIYILDQHRHPVPIGVWGELCIAGCSEIKGYINNKTLTDKKLLKHPVLSPGNNRLYCSGDIGRWLPDGNIELKGRIDSQVKIRGFRVELSEIESKILAIHRVKDCVVETKTDSQGQKYLAAYVVIQNIEISEIKKIISAYLPRHMIPKFIKLDSLPLMPNGKVDREHLPAPGTRQLPVPEPEPRQINRLLEIGQLNDINWQNREFLLEKTGMEKILAYYTRQLQHLLSPDTTPLKVAAVNIEPPSPGEQETPQETLKLKPHITQPRQQIKNLDRLPLPDRSLVDYERYGKHIGLAMVKNTISIQATRGCPYHCLYCHKIWPKHHVVRSAKHIFKELELYYHMGFRRFVFVDDIFNLDIKNSTEFLNLIIEKGLKVYLFFPNGLRTDLLTREYIDLMIKAGTVSLGLALETASPRLQKLIKKNMNLEKLRDNVQYLCEKYPRIILELFLMHGFPTETEEEAIMTLDFLESLKWVDFPYFHLLKIYPHTDMADMAVKNGISKQAILDSANLAFHELPQTLPFEKSFTLTMQADFLNNYFLSKERLLAKLPHQIKVLTRDEIVQKYDSYLPTAINSIDDLLEFAGISKDELSDIGIEPRGFMADNTFSVPDLNKKLQAHFPAQPPDTDALRVLLLDLSRFFTSHGEMLYDTAEPPLGLMYLLTYLNREFPGKIKGKIAKSRTDFDSFQELKVLLEEFQPGVIGIRTLTFFNRLFHQAGAWIRQWGFTGPIIAGGPYATSDYETVLQDQNIDLAVLSEGEVTFAHLIGKILENHKQLPGEEILEKIPGIAFVPGKQKPEPYERQPGSYAYVFNTSNPRVLTVLNRQRSLQLFPHDQHPKGIDLLEFYKKTGSTTPREPTMEIRVILNNSFFAEANAPGEEKQAPRTETEKKLAEIWSRVLGLDKNQIGIEDNFFDLGGHSLKATTLASTIHKELHVKIPLTQVFKLPTLRELSDYIKGTRTETFTSIEPVEEKEYYQLSSAQQRIFIRQQLNPRDTSYNNLSAVVLQGELNREKLTDTFAEMIHRHENFRTSFAMLEGEPVQEIHDKTEFEIEYYNMKEIKAEVEVKVEEERSLLLEGTGGLAPLPTEPATALISSFIRPFDLSRAPLLRVGLIKEQDNQHILLIDIHHIITDGVSHVVFSREMMALYDNQELPLIRCRYRDFTRWQQQLFTSGELKKQENYWLKQFAGEIPILNLPTDFPRPPVQRMEGNQVDIKIPSPLVEKIEKLALQTESTVYMVLLSIFNILLSQYSGQEDIIMGVTTAGRRHADLEPILGMFVNMLALRNQPRKHKTFKEFLIEVRNNTLQAFEHQDYQYEELVRKLDLQGNPGRNALFDIVFKLETMEIPEVTIPGLKLKPYLEYKDTTCKFDMVISAYYEPGSIFMNFKYSTHLFKESYVRTMTNHFLEISRQVLANQQIQLENIELSVKFAAAKVELHEEETLFGF